VPAFQDFTAFFAEIENLLILLPARRTGEPFGLRLLFGEGIEDAGRRMLPVPNDGKASCFVLVEIGIQPVEIALPHPAPFADPLFGL